MIYRRRNQKKLVYRSMGMNMLYKSLLYVRRVI
nr:MAG TPA: hypothetical protein [Bacteriophage sp.]